MTTPYGPFIVAEEFLSPLRCESIVKQYGLSRPSLDERKQPINYKRDLEADVTFPITDELMANFGAELEQRFGAKLRDDKPIFKFLQFFENSKEKPEALGCANSTYHRKKWERVRDIDLVGLIWLKSYCATVPLDPREEVYGGKLEFPRWNCSLTPQRGTMVIYPAGPQFLTSTSHVLVGNLELIKFGIKLSAPDGSPWQFEQERYSGNFPEWFV
jgi:hypothetical protein